MSKTVIQCARCGCEVETDTKHLRRYCAPCARDAKREAYAEYKDLLKSPLHRTATRTPEEAALQSYQQSPNFRMIDELGREVDSLAYRNRLLAELWGRSRR